MTRMLALVSAILLLSACTSLVEKGDKLYEQGMYQQAAEFYQQALNEDATDVEAQQRLNQARHKIIDRGLIEVRMLRLAANQVGAADKLEAILRNQSSWHIEAMGAQAATQNEEVRYAEQFLRTQAKDLADSAYPDKFRWFEQQYAFLISNAQLASMLSGYGQQLGEQAKDKCQTLAEQVQGQRFFLKQLAQTYCSAWGVSQTFKLDQRDHSRYRSIVFNKQLQLNTSKRRAHQQLIDGAVSELKDQFQQSIWYAPVGDKELKLTVTADVDYQRDSIQKQQEKRYLVKELRPDPNDKSKQVEVDIERVYIYPQTHYYEEYAARLSYSGQLAGMLLANQYMDSQSNQTISHSANFAEAELAPKSAKFLNQTETFSDYLSRLTQGINDELAKLWANQYCQNQYAQNSAENVMRCARVEPDNDYVNSWFERQFGISYKAMHTLYGV
ncbi:tetratricopeptide repeat-containing protein [Pseudoalteromonas sp. T1lg23B]|uniref:tetratricopeptide repeat-containing protein n=1 Tax=Pseudoalteromonas sp. T1lg23B TaxID=2077097 RepID=UPI000CF5FD56|nr:tetratricopeptide repeat-containing protein [Pseudoalteromonas sp. T1lg23B]